MMRAIKNWLGTLRFPVLVLLALALFAVNLVTPDPLPFIDEILLAVVALILARFKTPAKPVDHDESMP